MLTPCIAAVLSYTDFQLSSGPWSDWAGQPALIHVDRLAHAISGMERTQKGSSSLLSLLPIPNPAGSIGQGIWQVPVALL